MWVKNSVITPGLKNLPELTKVTDSYHSHASSAFHIGDMGGAEKRSPFLSMERREQGGVEAHHLPGGGV